MTHMLPHPVQVSPANIKGGANMDLQRERSRWLSEHVGRWVLDWDTRNHREYWFRDPDHAVQFSLTWGGS
jgi:hypothetical protein